jgi:large subunit ribosomal protein L6
MSRIGKKPIAVPAGVTVDITPTTLLVKGPKGELTQKLPPRLSVVKEGTDLFVKVVNEESTADRALWGTFGSIVKNMIQGVTEGYKKELEINGVGYKATMKGTNLSVEAGFTHAVEVTPLSKDIILSVEKNVITVQGPDKQQVGEMAAQIRRIKKPEPYKGKGIRYMTETIRRKAGKTAGKAA